MAISAGKEAGGQRIPKSRTDGISAGKKYRFEGHLTGYSMIPDVIMQQGLNALMHLTYPITITFASIDETGNVVIEGRT